jgi:hypothetical protein
MTEVTGDAIVGRGNKDGAGLFREWFEGASPTST